MKAGFETITPAKAASILANHNPHNRRLRQTYVDRLARDMEAGRWHDHHQAIGFNGDGSLVDGQHRLAAIVQSGKSQKLLVVREVPNESIGVIDAHSSRNTRDGLRLVHGIDSDHRMVGAAMYMEWRASKHGKTPAERIDAYLKHRRLIERAERLYCVHRHGLGRGVVLAVIARALATHPVEEIEPFCQILMTGETHRARDRIVLKLRDHLMLMKDGRKHLRAAADNMTVYWRTEYALHVWLSGGGGADERLLAATSELFYLPGEKRAEERAARKEARDIAKAATALGHAPAEVA